MREPALSQPPCHWDGCHAKQRCRPRIKLLGRLEGDDAVLAAHDARRAFVETPKFRSEGGRGAAAARESARPGDTELTHARFERRGLEPESRGSAGVAPDPPP